MESQIALELLKVAANLAQTAAGNNLVSQQAALATHGAPHSMEKVFEDAVAVVHAQYSKLLAAK